MEMTIIRCSTLNFQFSTTTMPNIAFLHELRQTLCWHIEYQAGKAYSAALRENFRNRTSGGQDSNEGANELLVLKAEDRKKMERLHAADFFSGYRSDLMAPLFSKTVVAEDGWRGYWRGLDKEDRVITLYSVTGAITRNGGGCSMGSISFRDSMIWAADQEQTIGHMVLIDSCGGSSFSSNDFAQGIDYARQKKQPVIALIDGDCCSAALHLAVMCDEVYYVHPKDRIGSIGTMAVFYTNKDGDQHSITQEIYHERYADISTEKNKMWREAADGNMQEIDDIISKDAREFAENVKRLRPKTPQEMLSGKTTTCAEAPYWTNGQSDMTGCIQRILDINKRKK
jgi:ClpP class serine protease